MTAYQENLAMEQGDIPYRILLSECHSPCRQADAHWHDVYEILLIRSGSCLQRVGEMEVTLSSGALAIIPPGFVHETFATSIMGCTIDVLQFMPHLLDHPLPPYCIAAPSISLDGLHRRFRHIEAAILEDGEKRRWIILGTILELMGQIERMLPENLLQQPSVTDLMARICRRIDDCPSLSLQQAAQASGYSPEHFSRRFRKEMGCTFRSYCEKIRMQHALQILQTQKLSLSQIAEKLGYADASSFARAFRHVYCLPPHQYMERHVPLGKNI